MSRTKVIIMGAAGRDFHNFRTFCLRHPEFRVCAFTATQIPFIDQRSYPRELAGEGYAEDIPIVDESELEDLMAHHNIDFVFFAYSDLSHREVMHKAARVQAAGASFVLLGPDHTCLESRRPVVSVTATRTGADLRILTVLTNPGSYATPDVMGATDMVVDLVERQGEELLEQAAEQAAASEVTCRTVRRWGGIPETILQTAEEEPTELIVLGSRTVSGWS